MLALFFKEIRERTPCLVRRPLDGLARAAGDDLVLGGHDAGPRLVKHPLPLLLGLLLPVRQHLQGPRHRVQQQLGNVL